MGPPVELLGRAPELEALTAELDAGRSVVLVGEPGIGKTALLRSVTAERRVFAGGALGLLGFLPYLAISRAVGPLTGGDPASVAREVVRRVDHDGILVLDDLHWADEATLGVIPRLVGTISLAAAIRSTDPGASRVIRQLAALDVVVIEVPPLSAEVAATLARQRAPRLDPEALARIVTRAGGNPLLIEELARAGVSTSLQLALQHRLRTLDPASRRLLELLAVAAQPVALVETRALRRLRALGLLETSADGVAVRHALIGEVVLEGLPAARRASLHRAAAALVADPVAKARQLLAAGDRRGARRVASAAAATAAPGRRAALVSIAAEAGSGPEATREQIAAAEQLVNAGWFREAARILDLAGPATPVERARQLAVRVHTRWGLGEAAGAVAVAEDGLQQLDGLSSEALEDPAVRDLRVRLLTDLAWSVTLQRDGARAVPLARNALEAAASAGLPTGQAQRVVALALSIAGAPFHETMPHLEAALAAARASGDVAEELLCGKLIVAGHEGGGDGAEGRRLGEAFVARAREAGMVAWEQSIRATLVSLANGQGEFKRALAEGMALLGEPLERRTRSQAAGYLGLTLVDLGRLDDAASLIETGLSIAPDDVDGRLDLLWAQVEHGLASGQPARADALAESVLRQFARADYCDLRHVRVTQAWARLELGLDPGPAIADVPMHAHVRGTVPESRAVGVLADTARMAGAATAPTAATERRLLDAARSFAAAATFHAPFHRRSELRCRWAEGEALRRAGRLDAAIAVLGAVEQTARALELLPLLGRIERSLRLAGVRRSAPRARGGQITARERQVLGLVADGLTNAQIAARLGVGRPTVARTLANAAAKLGTTSRAHTAIRAAEIA